MFQLPQISPETRAAARLASGQAVWLHHGGHYYWIMAAEGAQPASLPGVGGQLFITAERAEALGISVQSPLAALKLPTRSDTLAALIDPIKLSDSEILSDFEVKEIPDSHPAVEAMNLVRMAGTLPALIMGPQVGKPPVDSMIYESVPEHKMTLTRISTANLPLRAAPDSNVISFRDNTGAVHLAIIVGKPDMETAPLVRVHSSCLTGDILGSLRCDCGDQLQAALAYMHENNGGVLLYLDQEGRGIGLANKLRAYELQDRGMDTYTANRALGFADDERSFDVAATILRELGTNSVRLLSNSPYKVRMLSDAGIVVKERVSLDICANPHNQAYLTAKAEIGGHKIKSLTDKNH